MLKVALTGGIGSGKSTVCSLFRKTGAAIIDADIISRRLVKPGKPALKQIIEAFNEECITDKEGELNRKALRRLIFNDPVKKKLLEDILHKPIYAEIEKEYQALQVSYCIISVPLLIETNAASRFERVLVVDAPAKLQIQRIVGRDSMTAQEAIKIINLQAKREQRNAVADEVIINDRGLDYLSDQVKQLHGFYTEIAENKLNHV